MTPLRILFAGLVAVCVMLYVLNPGPGQFESFLRLDTAERAEDAARAADPTLDGTSQTFLADRTGRDVGGATGLPFEREEFYLWSLYRADRSAQRLGGPWTFLGIANWFVPIEQPEPGDTSTIPGMPAPPPAAPRPPGIPG